MKKREKKGVLGRIFNTYILLHGHGQPLHKRGSLGLNSGIFAFVLNLFAFGIQQN